MPPLPVKPVYGPTLPGLLGPAWSRVPRAARIAVLVLAALAVVGLASLVRGASPQEDRLIVRGPVVFNLRHTPALPRVAAQGDEVLRFEQREHGTVLQGFAVRPLTLPAHRGAAGGAYPVFADRVITGLGRTVDAFELADEGRIRINEVPGYEVGYRGRVGGERVWGRIVLLVPDEPGAREGLRLDLIARRGSGVSNPDDVGAVGQLKLPLRSLRFGTEAK